MRQSIRQLAALPNSGRMSRVLLEIALYAIVSGIFLYFVDVLLMQWQGLALH